MVNTRQQSRPRPDAPHTSPDRQLAVPCYRPLDRSALERTLDRPLGDPAGWLADHQLDQQIASYRNQVAAVFANHRHLHGCDDSDRCSCGAGWPCAQEVLAAQLLDDWV